VNRVVTRLIRGKLKRAVLGIHYALDQEAKQLMNRDVEGVLIRDVVRGGPAAKAGLRGIWIDEDGRHAGDIIIRIDDKAIRNTGDLLTALDQYSAGDTIRVTVLREGREAEYKITLAEQN
jgi:serine protease Do